MSDPVSVVLATYNTERFLRRAIDSVLQQTYTPLELIVVDDGSTDATRDVVAAYRDDPRVRYHYQRNAGQPAADNAGIALARAEFVAFNDADDIWLPDKLERQMPLFARSSRIGVVYSEIARIDEHERPIAAHDVPRYSGCVTERLFVRNCVPFSTSIVRRECFTRLGVFDASLRGSYDYDLWLRLSTEYEFAAVLEPTVLYREWPGQMSHRFQMFYEAGIKVMRRFQAAHPETLSAAAIREGWANTYTGRAYFMRKYEGANWKALQDYGKALQAHPAYGPAWKGVAETLIDSSGRGWWRRRRAIAS